MKGIKTIKKVLEENPRYKKLIKDVINRVTLDSINDINKFGIQGGFSGFIYYKETVPFAHKHQKEIVELLERDAMDLGENVYQTIVSFEYFRRTTIPEDIRREIFRYLSLTKCKDDIIPNLMAWYAAETVCRWFEA